MLPWGIVPMSSLPVGWGGGYMGIANQMLLVQPFCSERWETAFLNYGNDFVCIFFLHHHLHISLCTVMNSPVLSAPSFSHDSCVDCCAFDIVGCGFVALFLSVCIISFYTFWTELPGHVTKFLQLVIFIARSPSLQWSHSVLAVNISQTDMEGRQCCKLCCASSWSSLPMEDTGFWGSAPRLSLGLWHYSYNINKEKEAQRNKRGFFVLFFSKKKLFKFLFIDCCCVQQLPGHCLDSPKRPVAWKP